MSYTTARCKSEVIATEYDQNRSRTVIRAKHPEIEKFSFHPARFVLGRIDCIQSVLARMLRESQETRLFTLETTPSDEVLRLSAQRFNNY